MLLVVAMAIGAYGFDDPKGFRGLTWGTPLSEAKSRMDGWGSYPVCEEGVSQRCSISLLIGRVPVHTNLSFTFVDGRSGLSFVRLDFHFDGFEAIEQTMRERYGAPTSVEGGGENRTLHWVGPATHVFLSRAVRTSRSIVRGQVLETREAYGFLEPRSEFDQGVKAERERQRTRDPKKDL